MLLSLSLPLLVLISLLILLLGVVDDDIPSTVSSLLVERRLGLTSSSRLRLYGDGVLDKLGLRDLDVVLRDEPCANGNAMLITHQ